jgi:hypothetical protein
MKVIGRMTISSALDFRRLSILDVGGGARPMANEDGRIRVALACRGAAAKDRPRFLWLLPAPSTWSQRISHRGRAAFLDIPRVKLELLSDVLSRTLEGTVMAFDIRA